MELIVNYILLLVSGAACVYCFVLSRRLQRLNDTRDGIGASIVEMSAALSQTQQTLRLARQASIEGIDKLTRLLEDAEKRAPELAELLDALDELSVIAADDIEEAKSRALHAIDRRAAILPAIFDGAVRAPKSPPSKAAASKAAA